tara:strand:+ start:929 stop:1159 length:231 start_codon:yes stop_codon:yes gene_type:complete
MESQNKQIKAHLEKGNTITAISALANFNCFRLAARIKDLKDTGMTIKKRMITNKHGRRYAMYWLDARETDEFDLTI